MWRPLLSVAVCAVGLTVGMGNNQANAGGYLYSPYGYSPYSMDPVFAAPVPVGLSAPVVATYYAPAPVYAAPVYASSVIMPVEPVPVIVPAPVVVPTAYYVAPRTAVTRFHYGPFGGARAVTRLR